MPYSRKARIFTRYSYISRFAYVDTRRFQEGSRKQMSTGWFTTMKPTFQNEWLALPPKEAHQVLEKITLLTANPLPDGKLKKQLRHLNREIYRLESGDYRIIYTLQHPYISLLTLRRRKEDTYSQ